MKKDNVLIILGIRTWIYVNSHYFHFKAATLLYPLHSRAFYKGKHIVSTATHYPTLSNVKKHCFDELADSRQRLFVDIAIIWYSIKSLNKERWEILAGNRVSSSLQHHEG